MQKIISRVLIYGREPRQRSRAIAALSRCAVQSVEAADLPQAREILNSDRDDLPGLAVLHPDYQSEAGPLMFYNEIRGRAASRGIPLIILVETPLERAAVQSMNLARCTCCLSPLSHATLVFALPSLGLGIRDSVLFEQSPKTEAHTGFVADSSWLESPFAV